MKFGALFAVVLVAVKLAQQYFPASGIYAAGDCTGLLPLASVAAMQGRIAMYHALGEGGSPNWSACSQFCIVWGEPLRRSPRGRIAQFLR